MDTRTDAIFASLHENLDAEPLHREMRDVLRNMIERGLSPAEVVEAALATSTALCLDVEGIAKTACRLLAAGSTLAEASPVLQSRVRQHQREMGRATH